MLVTSLSRVCVLPRIVRRSCAWCQLEFSSSPIRPQRRAFPWTIGRVIDRGHPKLCCPNTPQPLDPAMRVQCRVGGPVCAHGGPRNCTCVLRSRVFCEHTNGPLASPPRAIGSFVQDMMLCPQGVGQLAGESTPRTCAQCVPAISSTARARPAAVVGEQRHRCARQSWMVRPVAGRMPSHLRACLTLMVRRVT